MTQEHEPRLLVESALLGVAGALFAQLFMALLRLGLRLLLGTLGGYTPPGIHGAGAILEQRIGPHGLLLIPVVTTLGGLLSSLLVYTTAPEAEGHGTDTVVSAFHRHQGSIRARVPAVKLIASALTIGSGGSAGREGPIALIAAGVGSIYANLARRGDAERRILVLAGMAAGLSAIFRSPMGTGVFAIEVLYGSMEFEIDALLYTMLSSAVAYTVNGLISGFGPLFQIPVGPAPRLMQYGWYAALGLAAGLIGTLLPQVFYTIRDGFRRLPGPVWLRPALGGLGVGLIALRLPEVLAGGYGWIQMAIDGRLALDLMLVLVFAKLLAFALTVASGGSGGVFAPTLYVGAMLGGACAILTHQPPAVFVVVAMAAVFGSAARVPIATMLMVTEMTGGYTLLVPAGIAVMIAYLLQARLSAWTRYGSLYEGQVPQRRDSPAHFRDIIQTGLQLLSTGPSLGDEIEPVDLAALLRTHIHFNLPDGDELSMGVLPNESELIGQPLRLLYRRMRPLTFEVVAILRREHVLLPSPQTLLSAGDRLIVLTSPKARLPLARWLTPIPEGAPARPSG